MKNIFTAVLIIVSFEISYSQTFNDSLIAYYPMDGNVNDMTTNGNNGTNHGAIPCNDRLGNSNSAYQFNGVNQYVSFHNGNNFHSTTFPFTITTWIKGNSSDFGSVFMNDNTVDTYTGLIVQVNSTSGGALSIGYGDGVVGTNPAHRRSKIGTTNVNDNQWHFIAAIIRGPADMDIWVDCANDGGTYSGAGGALAYNLNDGSSGMVDVQAGTYYYNGIIDDLRFYHRALSVSELNALMIMPSDFFSSSIYLGPDITLCSGNSVTLNPAGYSAYQWSTGATTQSVTIDSSGTGIGTININLNAETGHGCLASDNLNITFIDCSVENGIEDVLLNGINIFPNPASDNIQVIFRNSSPRNISVVNSMGQIEFKPIHLVSSSTEINISSLSSGIYFLRAIDDNGKNELHSFVINR
ncbi:hypothetical protein LBMAG27_13640 [Bacteroidota bacterium]|nr:hypothetical protein LBMAG27_13640 [Bacteroidota bacterium]